MSEQLHDDSEVKTSSVKKGFKRWGLAALAGGALIIGAAHECNKHDPIEAYSATLKCLPEKVDGVYEQACDPESAKNLIRVAFEKCGIAEMDIPEQPKTEAARKAINSLCYYGKHNCD